MFEQNNPLGRTEETLTICTVCNRYTLRYGRGEDRFITLQTFRYILFVFFSTRSNRPTPIEKYRDAHCRVMRTINSPSTEILLPEPVV